VGLRAVKIAQPSFTKPNAMHQQPVPEWHSASLLQSPLFSPLHPALAKLNSTDFPTLADCNALLAKQHSTIVTHTGLPLRFVAQQTGKLAFEQQYEPRCYLVGEVQMRVNNWHDLFNALVWLIFPKIKAALNARHYHALQLAQTLPNKNGRGALRDANTLLDESGVIVVTADDKLTNLLCDFQWKKLFWQQREQVKTAMGFYIFGHGLYEKSVQPYVGITGQGLLLKVEAEFFTWPLPAQLRYIDSALAARLAAPDFCTTTATLTPVPLLGIPGWCADNERESYYENTEYFRVGRRG
jgi:hypothetical protein